MNLTKNNNFFNVLRQSTAGTFTSQWYHCSEENKDQEQGPNLTAWGKHSLHRKGRPSIKGDIQKLKKRLTTWATLSAMEGTLRTGPGPCQGIYLGPLYVCVNVYGSQILVWVTCLSLFKALFRKPCWHLSMYRSTIWTQIHLWRDTLVCSLIIPECGSDAHVDSYGPRGRNQCVRGGLGCDHYAQVTSQKRNVQSLERGQGPAVHRNKHLINNPEGPCRGNWGSLTWHLSHNTESP